MRERPQPLDPHLLKTVSLAERVSKVTAAQSAAPFGADASVAQFLASLPRILAAQDLRELAGAVVLSSREGREVLLMCGGHVVKTGVAPLLIELVRRGHVTALAVNGAVAVHDVEMALTGKTSEDVGSALEGGMFGVARESADMVNGGAAWAHQHQVGLGEGITFLLGEAEPPYAHCSLLLQSRRAGIPVTVHVALGTDVVHQHPSASGEAIGAATLHDFRLLAAVVARLEGGVVINVGSAVVLPEVFVKALNLARNLGHQVHRFTAADFDFVRQYRPEVNVVGRPTAHGGRGFTFTGHHELLIPLLYASVMAACEQDLCDGGGEPIATH